MAFTYTSDLYSANFDNVGGTQTPLTNTIASAALIAPTGFLTIVTGTVAVATIQLPYQGFSGMIALLFTNAAPAATVITGNIGLATTVVQNKVLLMTYEPVGGKWWPSY